MLQVPTSDESQPELSFVIVARKKAPVLVNDYIGPWRSTHTVKNLAFHDMSHRTLSYCLSIRCFPTLPHFSSLLSGIPFLSDLTLSHLGFHYLLFLLSIYLVFPFMYQPV